MFDCIDLFCGAGGFSLGLRQAGINIQIAIDKDFDCQETYRRNHPETELFQADIGQINLCVLKSVRRASKLLILAGGPPCQLFSQLNRNSSDNPAGIRAYMRAFHAASPDYAVFENVPAILRKRKSWNFLINSFAKAGYEVTFEVLESNAFGVPQKRKRMIVVASKHGEVQLPQGKSRQVSVRQAIGHLPKDFGYNADHYGLALAPVNLEIIRSLKAGESSRSAGDAFCDSYSRMNWDALAPTITTKCISFSNGRFGHPEFDRALTVHEAAILQGFPRSFRFHGNLWAKARQVGNAVPPPIGKAIGKAIIKHSETR